MDESPGRLFTVHARGYRTDVRKKSDTPNPGVQLACVGRLTGVVMHPITDRATRSSIATRLDRLDQRLSGAHGCCVSGVDSGSLGGVDAFGWDHVGWAVGGESYLPAVDFGVVAGFDNAVVVEADEYQVM